MDDIRIYHPATTLPTPGVPLKIKLDTGEVIDGVRPLYISSRSDDDLGYETLEGEKILRPCAWAIR